MLAFILLLENGDGLANEIGVFDVGENGEPQLVIDDRGLCVLQNVIMWTTFPRKTVEVTIYWAAQS